MALNRRMESGHDLTDRRYGRTRRTPLSCLTATNLSDRHRHFLGDVRATQGVERLNMLLLPTKSIMNLIEE
jgi:hypothetical protein